MNKALPGSNPPNHSVAKIVAKKKTKILPQISDLDFLNRETEWIPDLRTQEEWGRAEERERSTRLQNTNVAQKGCLSGSGGMECRKQQQLLSKEIIHFFGRKKRELHQSTRREKEVFESCFRIHAVVLLNFKQVASPAETEAQAAVTTKAAATSFHRNSK